MASSNQYGAFVNQNYVWDIQQLQESDLSPQVKELLVRLYQNINNISMVLNLKDTGLYPTTETVNGQFYFPNPANNSTTAQRANLRNVYRKVINYTTALPNAGAAVIPHGITCTTATTFTRIYGVANDPTGKNYIPIPYASPTLANNIELKVDATNVTITTGSNRTNFTVTYVVLEYMQN
jgi:hypothetical protein